MALTVASFSIRQFTGTIKRIFITLGRKTIFFYKKDNLKSHRVR